MRNFWLVKLTALMLLVFGVSAVGIAASNPEYTMSGAKKTETSYGTGGTLSVVDISEKIAFRNRCIVNVHKDLVSVRTVKVDIPKSTTKTVTKKTTTTKAKAASKPKSTYRYSSKEMEMLYRVVEAEVGNESKLSKKYSTWVVMNRVNSKRYPNTVKGVIFQRGQYSTTLKGHGYWTKKPSKSTIAAVNEAVKEGVQIPSDIFYADGYVHKGQVKYRKIDKTYYCRDKK